MEVEVGPHILMAAEDEGVSCMFDSCVELKFKETKQLISNIKIYWKGRENAREFKLNEVSKQVVATAVVKEKLVKDGDAVVLDAGSSATYVAETIFSTELKNLSILTHNNVIILAVSGLTASTNPASYSGVYCHAVVETRIKELLFSWPAERRIIIADYSKIGKGDSHMFGDLSKMKSKLEPLGRGYVVTTKPPKNAKSEEIKVFRDTITTLKEWKIEVIEVDGK